MLFFYLTVTIILENELSERLQTQFYNTFLLKCKVLMVVYQNSSILLIWQKKFLESSVSWIFFSKSVSNFLALDLLLLKNLTANYRSLCDLTTPI